jgi:hypothetical protein
MTCNVGDPLGTAHARIGAFTDLSLIGTASTDDRSDSARDRRDWLLAALDAVGYEHVGLRCCRSGRHV